VLLEKKAVKESKHARRHSRGTRFPMAETLAVNGGPAARSTPLPPRHLWGEEEKLAAMRMFDDAIDSGGVIGYSGPEELAYEKEFAEYMGGGFADLVNSGTSAVYCAIGALQLPPGSEVVVPPITDPGGAMPVAMHNLVPIVADAAPGTFNAGASEIEAVITERTSAIVIAHIAGEPCDMGPIMAVANKHNLPVVEDCAQAHGARYEGQLCGTFGAVAAISTMSGKHHATGPQGASLSASESRLCYAPLHRSAALSQASHPVSVFSLSLARK
jgi:perosamine synthetase